MHGKIVDGPNAIILADLVAALARAKLVIGAHLSERQLSPEWIAAKTNVSRTRLYELFKPEGGISRYLQKARATKLRQLLAQAEMSRFSVGALCLGVGFASESHGIRRFSQFFSVSPGLYRRQLGDVAASGHTGPASQFDSWMRALNIEF